MIKVIRRTLFIGALFGVVPFANAGPGPQYWETLHNEAQFKQVKTGERLVYVCKECNTVSDLSAANSEQVAELCKEGSTVSCPSCKMTAKVARKQSRNDSPDKKEIVYVNDKGEECGFIAKVAEGK